VRKIIFILFLSFLSFAIYASQNYSELNGFYVCKNDALIILDGYMYLSGEYSILSYRDSVTYMTFKLTQKDFSSGNIKETTYYGIPCLIVNMGRREYIYQLQDNKLDSIIFYLNLMKSNYLIFLKRIDSQQLILDFYKNEGDIAYSLEKYDDALENYKNANNKKMIRMVEKKIQEKEKLEKQKQLEAEKKGDVALSNNDLDSALSFYKESGNQEKINIVLNKKGDVALSNNDLDSALSFYKESGNQEKINIVLNKKGDVAFSKNDLDSALSLYKETKNLEKVEEVNKIIEKKGDEAFRNNDFDQALLFYKEINNKEKINKTENQKKEKDVLTLLYGEYQDYEESNKKIIISKNEILYHRTKTIKVWESKNFKIDFNIQYGGRGASLRTLIEGKITLIDRKNLEITFSIDSFDHLVVIDLTIPKIGRYTKRNRL